MKTVRVADVSDFVLDGTHGSPVRTESGVPVLSAQNVRDGRLSFDTDRFTSIEEYNAFERRLPLDSGDVLLTIVGTIGRAAVVVAKQPLVFQRSVAVIRPLSGVLDSRFLFHTLQSRGFQTNLARSSNQSSQAGVYLGRLKEIEFPLPPFAEQRRIADVLDRAEALRAKRRAALALVETMPRAIFLELFGHPVANPNRLTIRALGALGVVKTGGTPPSGLQGMFGGSIPFVTPGDLESDQPARRTVTNDGARESETVRRGAALVCCIGATIGKMAKARERSAFNQQINAIEWDDSIDDDYGIGALRFLKKRIVGLGASTTLPILKKSSFERLEIPVAPLALQRTFALRVAAIEKLKSGHSASLAKLDELFASLQHRAFRGEL